jgi:hypothetical protein
LRGTDTGPVHRETKALQYSDVSDLPVVDEAQATQQVAEIYADIKREMQLGD